MSRNSPSPNYMQPRTNENSNMCTNTPKQSPIRNSHFENRYVVSSPLVIHQACLNCCYCTFNIMLKYLTKRREPTPNQSTSVSTVASGSSGQSQQQHQHQILSSVSPLSQYITNGEVQNLRTTTPPHNLSNPQTQQRGQLFACKFLLFQYNLKYIHIFFFLYRKQRRPHST